MLYSEYDHKQKLVAQLGEIIEQEKRVYIQKETLSRLSSDINSLGKYKYYAWTKPLEPTEREKQKQLSDLGCGTAVLIAGVLISASAILLFSSASIIFLVVGIAVIRFGVSVMRDYNKRPKEAMEEYEKKLIEYNSDVAADKSRVDRELIRKNKLEELYRILNKKHSESKELLDCLYTRSGIYQKYRSIVAACSFYEYFQSGRCDEFEGPNGAYNKFEEEARLNLIISKLDDVVERLDRIENNQHTLHTSITEGNQMIKKLVSNANAISKKVDFIASQSEIAAECAKWTALEQHYRNRQ